MKNQPKIDEQGSLAVLILLLIIANVTSFFAVDLNEIDLWVIDFILWAMFFISSIWLIYFVVKRRAGVKKGEFKIIFIFLVNLLFYFIPLTIFNFYINNLELWIILIIFWIFFFVILMVVLYSRKSSGKSVDNQK